MQYQQNQQQGFQVPSQFLPPQQLQQPQQQNYQAQPPAYNPGYVSPQYAGSGTPSASPAAVSPYSTAYGMNHGSNADPALYSALADTERLIIKQEVEYLEAAANIAANAVNLDALGAFGEQANKYDIFTDNGGKKFRVIETSNYLCRCCLRPNHELQLHVFLPQDTQNKVMVMERPWKCGHCCSLTDVCQQEMKVYQGE
jgi:Scramblase